MSKSDDEVIFVKEIKPKDPKFQDLSSDNQNTTVFETSASGSDPPHPSADFHQVKLKAQLLLGVIPHLVSTIHSLKTLKC